MTDRITDLVRDFTGRTWRLIARITGDPEEARDLTQDVMIRMLGRSGSLRDPAKLKAYVFRSAYHAALNATRSRRRRERAHASYAAEGKMRSVGATANAVERMHAEHVLRTAVAQLSERQREVITLKYFGGLTLIEIAAALKISEGTARVHLVRALTNLRATLAPAGKER